MRSTVARPLWVVVFFLAAQLIHADALLTTKEPRLAAGAPLELELLITNDGAEPLAVDIAQPLHVRFETETGVTILSLDADASGELVVPPGAFVRIPLKGAVPAEAEGTATLSATGIATSTLLLEIQAAEPHDATALAKAEAPQEGPAGIPQRSALIDKPPPIPVSAYEPVYFLIGGDGGLNAKFQISFRYRLFDGKGRLAEKLPWIDDLYLSFTQTSLWDLHDLSKPFRDSSYRPRLFFSNYDLHRFLDGQLRIGFEAGAGHESNGKDGDDSRSYNMFYVRPVVTLGDPDGLRAYAAPLIRNYVADGENPTLSHYRGYVDWLFGIGSKGGLDFSATLRKGTRSSYGSIEINASYPLSKLSGGDLTGWLLLQYFNGYGESLLDYDKKLDSQLRLGVAVAL